MFLRRRFFAPLAVTSALLVGLAAPACAAAPDGGGSAEQILGQAESRARAEGKNILLDFSASWCGNCRLFERFLADPTIHPIMDKAFVMTTLITGERPDDTRHANTPGGQAFEATVGGKDAGFPFIVMLDSKGKPIVDSRRPNGTKPGRSNIGNPDSPAEVDWFMHMLQVSAPSLSPGEIATIHAWLTAHGHSA